MLNPDALVALSSCCMHLMHSALQGALGRDFAGRRFGPRPLDLDIIFYSNQDLQHDRLSIPHPRWQERDFVKAPLADLISPEEGSRDSSWSGLADRLANVRTDWELGKPSSAQSAQFRVVSAAVKHQ